MLATALGSRGREDEGSNKQRRNEGEEREGTVREHG